MNTTAETVIADLRGKNIKGAAEHLKQLETQDGSFSSDAYKRDIAAINSRVDLKQLGLKDAGQLLGADRIGNLMVTSADNTKVQHVMPDGKLYDTMPNMSYSFRQMSAELEKQSSEDQISQLGPGKHHLTLISEGMARDLDVTVPASYDGKTALPVVVMVPGANRATHGLMAGETRGDQIAEQQNFIAVYPYFLDKPVEAPSWFPTKSLTMQAFNSPTGGISKYVPGYNDETYMSNVNKLVESKLNIDLGRRYLFGFSDGGAAGNDIVASSPDTYAAFGSSHGTITGIEHSAKQAGKTAFWDVVSNEGAWIPGQGGPGSITNGMERMKTSAPGKQFETWANANGCQGEPQTHKDQEQEIRQFTAQQCGGAAVKEINRYWQSTDLPWQTHGGGGQHAVDGPGEGGLPFNLGAKATWDSFSDFWSFAKQFRKLPDGRLVHS